MRSPHNGRFKCRNPEKYIGNVDDIWYRSGLEYKFYRWLDTEPLVLKWSSEEIVIPYISPKDHKQHRYFPDAWAEMKTKRGIVKYLVEIKPSSQTHLPKPQKRQTKRYLNEVMTYAINNAKWSAASQFCQEHGWEWKIITEKQIFGPNGYG